MISQSFTKPALRTLGETGLKISPIGLGTVKFGRNTNVRYPEGFDIPDDKTLLALLELATELGINFLDTAPAYGTSEATIGRLLKKSTADWLICTKTGEFYENDQSYYDYSRTKTLESIETSLRLLGRERLDLVLIHSDGQDESIIQHSDVVETLMDLKAAGKIGAIGMSTKTVDGAMAAMEFADVLMISLNQSDLSQAKAISAAAEKNIGILIKKALASGHADNAQVALNFACHYPGVTSAIVGTISASHLSDNVTGPSQP